MKSSNRSATAFHLPRCLPEGESITSVLTGFGPEDEPFGSQAVREENIAFYARGNTAGQLQQNSGTKTLVGTSGERLLWKLA